MHGIQTTRSQGGERFRVVVPDWLGWSEYLGVSTESSATSDHPVRVMTFDAFYQSERGGLLAVALMVSGDPSRAEDLVHDVFEAVYRDWDRVARRENPSAWVKRMLLNKSVSAFRRSRAEVRALTRFRVDTQVHFPNVTGDLERMWLEVRRLPKRQFQVVALRYVGDLSLGEIADVLGCSSESVRTHMRRARSTLAKRLDLEEF
jgi:RNA polymerase sigma factor (sigma-70 family)